MSKIADKDYYMSQYLAFRYLADDNYCWKDGYGPDPIQESPEDIATVDTAEEISLFLSDYVAKHLDARTCIFLSGGIDSAILASYLPEGTRAYTIRFIADGAIDESLTAALYAEEYKLDHHIVEVYWDDYINFEPLLMLNKKAPLHAAEVALYKAAITAKDAGYTRILLGNGADSLFGGLDKLLSRDWRFEEFVIRYSFIMP